MKAWRNESAAKINAWRAAGSTEATARKQMQEGLMLSKMFPIKNSGNWLLNGLLHKGGYLAPTQSQLVPRLDSDKAQEVAASPSFLGRLKKALGM